MAPLSSVMLHVVPNSEEIVSIDHEGTELVLPPASAADAFAATVKRLQLHKRRRGAARGKKEEQEDAAPLGGEEEAEGAALLEAGGRKRRGAASADDAASSQADFAEEGALTANPFEAAHRELSAAAYELRQLTELTTLLCSHQLFRLEHLQRDDRSNFSGLTDILMAFESKKVALADAVKLLRGGTAMLRAARRSQSAYLAFVARAQTRWRMQAIAHGSFPSSLRAQEPLAVDCGYFSAGSKSKAARQRQTRDAARVVVDFALDGAAKGGEEDKGDAMELDGPATGASPVRLDIDESSFRAIKFAVEAANTGECQAFAYIAPSVPAEAPRAADDALERELDRLQSSEFCSELFQVLSVEAVRSGELSSGGGFAADATSIANARVKVAVIENLLDRVSVSVDAHHVLSISLVPPPPPGAPTSSGGGRRASGSGGSSSSSNSDQARPFAHEFCRMAGVVAQEHLRNVHRGTVSSSLLSALVDMYRQMDAFARITAAVDSVSHGLTRDSRGAPSRLFKLSAAWTHREDESFLELRLGAQVLVRCKLTSGRLVLGAILLADPQRTLPLEWRVAQQGGDSIFACPNAVGKLQRFLHSLVIHEFVQMLARALLLAPGRGTVQSLDAATGVLHWVDALGGAPRRIAVAVTDAGTLRVECGGIDITRPTVEQLVREIMLL
jgi:hypothetical protein